MANFVTDYSGLAAAGAGFNSFAQAYQDAQDRQVKKQETEAKINAMNAQMQRDATDTALKARAQRLTVGPGGPTDLQDAEPTMQEKMSDSLAQWKEGSQPEIGPDGKPTGRLIQNPATPAVIGAKAKASAMGPGGKFDTTENDKHNADWEKFATAINNPSSRAQIGRYQQQLDKAGTLNALANQIGVPEGGQPPANETSDQRKARFNKADSRQLYEFAKSADQLISAGGATVYGTDHLMPKDMQIGASKIAEWAAGGPIPANAGEFINRYLDSANRESKYFQTKRDNSVSGVSAGFEHLKKLDPDRWERVLKSTSAPTDNPQAPQQQAPAPQGLFPQKQGILGKLSGLVTGAGPVAQTAQAPAQAQDPQIAKFAKDNNLDYAHAEAIIAERKAKRGG